MSWRKCCRIGSAVIVVASTAALHGCAIPEAGSDRSVGTEAGDVSVASEPVPSAPVEEPTTEVAVLISAQAAVTPPTEAAVTTQAAIVPPSLPAPSQVPATNVVVSPTQVETTAAPSTPAPVPSTAAPAPPAIQPFAELPPSESLDPRFDTCKDAKRAGYGPYRRGQDPEYEWYRDRDGDGIVCE